MKKELLFEEIIDFIRKEKTLDEICKKFELSEFQVMGIVHDLKEVGENIIAVKKNNNICVQCRDEIEDLHDNSFTIPVEDNEHMKILAISDTRLCSKYEQLSILNDVYRKAYNAGIKTVIHCGDISEGLYSPASPYYDTIIRHDTESQANYIAKNYPLYEGMKTYFITGEKDHTHVSKEGISIGKLISSKRDDLVFLGPNHCLLTINNSKILVRHPKGKIPYTVSYKQQQYISSVRSEDKVDLILHGHWLQAEKLPFREVEEISVPGIVATTAEMTDNGLTNNIGAWIIDLSFNKEKKIDKINTEFIPYYKTIKNDFEVSKRVPLISGGDLDKKLNKVFNYIKNNDTIEEVAMKLEIPITEVYGVIDLLKINGKQINIIQKNDEFIINKKRSYKQMKEIKPNREDLIKTSICVVSDTHLGTKEQQLTLVNKVYEEAYRREISTILHCGDMLDGDYVKIRPEQQYQLFLRGFDEQVEYVVDMYPEIEGIKTYFIQGSHDETHLKNGGATPGKWIQKCRNNDMIYLGQDNYTINLNGVKIEMDHPGGGVAKSLSYKPQNAIEQMVSGEKPKIFLQGHYHKCYYFCYRNVHSFLVPCLVDQSQFMQKQKISNIMGAYFLDIYSDEKGNVQYIDPNEYLFKQDEAIKDDYKTCKRLIKK